MFLNWGGIAIKPQGHWCNCESNSRAWSESNFDKSKKRISQTRLFES